MDELETTETSEPTEKSFSEELRDQVIFSAAATAATLVTIVVLPPVINGVSAGAKKVKVWYSDRKTKKLNEKSESE